MEHMRDFWAREWLLRSIAMRHDTHKLDEIIKIATAAGYICSNGNLTKTGREFIELCKDDDEKIRLQSQMSLFKASVSAPKIVLQLLKQMYQL